MRIVPALPDHALPPEAGRWSSGIASLDAVLAGGMTYGAVHEIYAAEAADAAAVTGFAVAVTVCMMRQSGHQARAPLWLRSRRAVRLGGILQASGWAELGGAPGDALVGVVPDAMTLLRAAADALRCAALGAVIAESWGRMPELDLTASRRLALYAERSGVPLFLLRIDAAPVPSAAQTRWQVAAAPSRALPGHAPGLPTFDIELLRQKSGPSGMGWRLEWDRDRRIFQEAPLSGAVVSVPARRPAADRGTGSSSRYAA